MTLQEKLLELRTEKGLSQKDVADKLGLHVNSYSRVERGTKPSASMLTKLSDLFGEDLSAYVSAPRAGKAAKPVKAAEDNKAAKTGKADEGEKAGDSDDAADAEAKESGNEAESMDIRVELQYGGKAVQISDIIEKAKEASGNSTGKLSIYVKHEENRVYYVAGSCTGSFEI
ncbi:MAG: helix-turn-helix transcriptional regulator [Lachnospiraceae bacterium]|nr:helix-turn-helix transcriptional regulator [Lachnospiraceae bacterium]